MFLARFRSLRWVVVALLIAVVLGVTYASYRHDIRVARQRVAYEIERITTPTLAISFADDLL